MGHGGTLDPMATGVLVVGVGAGTRALARYTGGGRKTYECVVAFGVESESFDVTGRVRRVVGCEGVRREAVQAVLQGWREQRVLRQKPPAYSAKWVDGERAYDLMRRGVDVRALLDSVEVELEECEVVEWWDAGTHAWGMRIGQELDEEVKQRGKKRKRDGKEKNKGGESEKARKLEKDGPAEKLESDGKEATPGLKVEQELSEPLMSGAIPPPDSSPRSDEEPDEKPETTTTTTTATVDPEPVSVPVPDPLPGPAARLRLTVSSGFYVRSLCHDLGAALGSAGVMAELMRTRQAEFALDDGAQDAGSGSGSANVLEYADLERGEAVWGPKVRRMLEAWLEREGEGRGGVS